MGDEYPRRLHVGKLLNVPLRTDTTKLIVDAVISTPALDRDDEVVDPMGVQLDFYRIVAPVMFAHQLNRPPIATSKAPDGSLSAWCSQADVRAKGYFSESIKDSETHFRMVEEGLLVGTSIGFRSLNPVRMTDEESKALGAKYPVIRHRKSELTEWSLVPVGSNRYTVAHVVSKGMIGAHRLGDEIIRSLMPFVEPAGAWSNGWDIPLATTPAVVVQSDAITKVEPTMTTPAAPTVPATPVAPAVPPTVAQWHEVKLNADGTWVKMEGGKSGVMDVPAAVAAPVSPAVFAPPAKPAPVVKAEGEQTDDTPAEEAEGETAPEMKAGAKMAQCHLAYASEMTKQMHKLLGHQEDPEMIEHAKKVMKENLGHIGDTMKMCAKKYPDDEFKMADLPDFDEEEDPEDDPEAGDEGEDEETTGGDEEAGGEDEGDEEEDKKAWAELVEIADRLRS